MKDNTKQECQHSSERSSRYKKKLDFWGPVSHLRESTISDLESPSIFQVIEEKKYLNLSINKKLDSCSPVSQLREL